MLWIYLLLLLSMLYEIFSARILRSYNVDWRENRLQHMVYSILQIVWVLTAGYFCMPVPVLFAGIYVQQVLFLGKKNRTYHKISNYLIITNILFSAGYLICYGLIEIFMVLTDMPLEGMALHISALVGSKTFMIIICFLPWDKVINQQRGEIEDNRREKLFSRILIYFLLYIFIDGCLCMYGSEGIFIPLMMVAGNLLLLLLFWLFIRREYLVIESEYLEEEHRRLRAETALEEYMTKKRERMAERDTLTGAYSRRFATEQIRKMNQKMILFSIVYIDLDGLKKINDQFGHHAGDEYLLQFVIDLTDRLQKEDMVARLGGDEFLVLLPGCSAAAATERMNLIRLELVAESRKTGAVPFSFGVASGGDSPEEMIESADQNMYLDKRHRKEIRVC